MPNKASTLSRSVLESLFAFYINPTLATNFWASK